MADFSTLAKAGHLYNRGDWRDSLLAETLSGTNEGFVGSSPYFSAVMDKKLSDTTMVRDYSVEKDVSDAYDVPGPGDGFTAQTHQGYWYNPSTMQAYGGGYVDAKTGQYVGISFQQAWPFISMAAGYGAFKGVFGKAANVASKTKAGKSLIDYAKRGVDYAKQAYYKTR